MSYKVKATQKSSRTNNLAARAAIRRAGGEVVLRHALGMASVAYQVYPVGPEHKDGSPHTRDTFAIVKDGKIIATKGQFEHPLEKYDFETAVSGGGKGLKFIAGGASFFLEFGTIYIEPMPILRTLIKKAKADITNDLRKINIRGGRV